MKLSTERILTTHVGSLPRPKSLLDVILAREEGRPVDAAAFEAQSDAAVAEVVAKQVTAGVDIQRRRNEQALLRDLCKASRRRDRRITAQVLVVGGGPVGLSLAIDLARRGVGVTFAEMRAAGEVS